MGTMSQIQLIKSTDDSVLAGVCGGLAKTFNIETWIVRTGFVLGTVVFGLSIVFYIAFAIAFTKDENLNEAYQSKVLGVCSRLAKKFSIDVALVRTLFLLSLLLTVVPSFGTTLLIYFVLYFILPEAESNSTVVDVKAKDLST